jgi:hypothetical protein
MKYLFFLFSSIFLFSCSSNDQHPNPHGIVLNNGEKWTVNAEMKPHIEQEHLILTTYINDQETDYQSLAEELKGQTELLIQSCTMTGESHEELHKWLHPHITLISDLGKAEDVESANKIISDIQASFENYHHFFQ